MARLWAKPLFRPKTRPLWQLLQITKEDSQCSPNPPRIPSSTPTFSSYRTLSPILLVQSHPLYPTGTSGETVKTCISQSNRFIQPRAKSLGGGPCILTWQPCAPTQQWDFVSSGESKQSSPRPWKKVPPCRRIVKTGIFTFIVPCKKSPPNSVEFSSLSRILLTFDRFFFVAGCQLLRPSDIGSSMFRDIVVSLCVFATKVAECVKSHSP